MRRNSPRKKFDEEIQMLHKRLEAKAAELGAAEGRLSQVHSEIAAQKEVAERLSSQRKDLLKEVKKLEEMLDAKNSYLSTQISEGYRSMQGISGRIEALKVLHLEAESQLEAKKKLTEGAREIEEALNVGRRELQRVINEGKAIASDNASKSKSLDAREVAVAEKESRAQELLSKNSSVLTDVEVKLGLLEHYVKRLQRLYDKNGIKIDLLAQFNIKRDSLN